MGLVAIPTFSFGKSFLGRYSQSAQPFGSSNKIAFTSRELSQGIVVALTGFIERVSYFGKVLGKKYKLIIQIGSHLYNFHNILFLCITAP